MRAGLLLAVIALGIATPGAAQSAPASTFWNTSVDRLTFEPAELSLPIRAGSAEYHESAELSHSGEGLDTVVKYRSPDREIIASIYAYYPSFTHTGVQALATDQAIRGPKSPALQTLGTSVTSAAGKMGVALMTEYGAYLDKYASRAAFIKAGRWMVKLRVTGPEARSAEVGAVMRSLLDGLRFEGSAQPSPATPLATPDCTGGARSDAKVVAGSAEAAVIAATDVAGEAQANGASGNRSAGRMGQSWCQTTLAVGDAKLKVLEKTGSAATARAAGSSAMLVLVSDAGGVLEVVRLPENDEHVLLHHAIGEVKVIESYAGLPSMAQIARLFAESVPIRARVKLRADGTAKIDVSEEATASQN